MYQMVKQDGRVCSVKDPVFLKRQTNGVSVACAPGEADGLLWEGVCYALTGRQLPGCERVDLVEVADRPDLTSARNAASIDYLSMMTGVELPQGGV